MWKNEMTTSSFWGEMAAEILSCSSETGKILQRFSSAVHVLYVLRPYLAWHGPGRHTAPWTAAWVWAGLRPPQPAWWAQPPRPIRPLHQRCRPPSRSSSAQAGGLRPGWSKMVPSTHVLHLEQKETRMDLAAALTETDKVITKITVQ